MKPIYSFHTRVKTKNFLLPSEEKPCPAYIAPLKSKWGEMIWWGEAEAGSNAGSVTSVLVCCRQEQSPGSSCSPAVVASASHPHPTPHFCVGLTGLLLSLCP